ncbi:MAG: hypothetical protein ACRDZY_08375 [Acidimicrobiales bacterium]
MSTVHAAIGNSDDKLSQRDWSSYLEDFHLVMVTAATQVHGVWHSAPVSQFQNACIAAEVAPEALDGLRAALLSLRRRHRQESVAFNVSETELV